MATALNNLAGLLTGRVTMLEQSHCFGVLSRYLRGARTPAPPKRRMVLENLATLLRPQG